MESCTLVASSSSSRKRVIGELNRGREIADQLRTMLRDGASGLTARGLVEKILDSFTDSLSVLTTAGAESDEVSELPPGRKSEDSGESCKTPAPKDRRGCYKRRKISETWTKESSSLFEDGYAWRKYGQKVILNAKHPRNYFRCTHKFDQGCQATKQVQKIQDDPLPLFKTTYHGNHTCKNLLKSTHQIIMDAAAAAAAAQDDSSIIWSFESRQPNYKPNNNNNNGLLITPVKQENKSPSPSSSSMVNSDHDDYFISSDQLRCTLTDGMTAFSSASDHGDVISSDVYSCTASTDHTSMEMDQMFMSYFMEGRIN